MPQKDEKVSLYNGSKNAFIRAINNNEVDPNGIYFIDGIEHEIYVGSQLYGSGAANSSMQHVILHCYGTISADTPYIRQLSDVRSTSPISILVGGVFLNGLRAVDELNVSVTVGEVEIDDEGYYIPVITISSSNNYPDSYTEVTVDLYISKSGQPIVSDVITVETMLDQEDSSYSV